MTALALLLEACTLAGVREPMAFYALSEPAQELWLAHAKNKVSGAYLPHKARPEPTNTPEWRAAAIERARSRGTLPPETD